MKQIGEPVLEVTLNAGDLLYFPRGFVHQANALPDTHSLHITISTYQCNSWYDLMKTVCSFIYYYAYYLICIWNKD